MNTIELDSDVKRKIVSFIFSTKFYKYFIMKYDSHLKLLVDKKYYVSQNYSGLNSFLVFIKINTKYLSYIVVRKSLSYDIKSLILDQVQMYKVHITTDDTIYNGTVFDGVLKKNNEFIITDCNMFRGKNISDENMIDKLNVINEYLIINGKHQDTIKLSTSILHDISCTEELLRKKNAKSISFYPHVSEQKLIYIQENNNVELYSPTQSQQNTNNNQKILTFEMKKTDIVDNYKLFLLQEKCVYDNSTNTNKTIKTSYGMGIAYLPTIASSQLCKNTFINNNNQKIMMKCKLVNNKWQPIERDYTAKYPSNIKDL